MANVDWNKYVFIKQIEKPQFTNFIQTNDVFIANVLNPLVDNPFLSKDIFNEMKSIVHNPCNIKNTNESVGMSLFYGLGVAPAAIGVAVVATTVGAVSAASATLAALGIVTVGVLAIPGTTALAIGAIAAGIASVAIGSQGKDYVVKTGKDASKAIESIAVTGVSALKSVTNGVFNNKALVFGALFAVVAAKGIFGFGGNSITKNFKKKLDKKNRTKRKRIIYYSL